jgi:CubicO group peptidase (beta-lactamase class C family)
MRDRRPFPRVLLCLLALLASPLQAREPASPSFAALDAAIDQALAATGAPGAAVVVVAGGRVVHRRGFGTTALEGGRPVAPDTLFRLGSTSKVFTALAAAQLAGEGTVDLGAPIGQYAADLHPAVARLTLHQLLSHTSGLSDEAPMEGPHEESALASRVRGWDERAFFAEPGEIFSYANPGYVLAGYVLERAAGKPFADLVREEVLAPLGMARSTYRPLEALTWPVALGHHRSGGETQVLRPFPEHAGNYPPGSLFSSADEMGRLLVALLDGGRLGQAQVLAASAVETVSAAHAAIAPLGREYGYGLERRRERGHLVVGHSGGRLGYGSVFFTVPSRGVGVAVLTNLSGAILFDAAREALALQVPPAEEAPASAPAPGPRPLSAEEMSRYAGRYVNSERVTAELAVADGKLMLDVMGGRFEVSRVGEDALAAPGAGPFQSFRLLRGGDGRPRFLACEHWALRRVDG